VSLQGNAVLTDDTVAMAWFRENSIVKALPTPPGYDFQNSFILKKVSQYVAAEKFSMLKLYRSRIG
jgi:hypothetical protein